MRGWAGFGKRWAVVAMVAVLAPVGAGALAAGPAVAAAAKPGAFVPLTPARLLDTRTGLGAPAAAPVAAGGVLSLPVTGRAGVPGSGVAAVALTVTVTNPAGTGYLAAYPDGTTRPALSQLSFVPGATVSNLVVVAPGTAGAVALYNGSDGTADLVADVAGYYRGGTASSPGAFVPLAPARILDSRQGQGASGPIAAGAIASVPVRGQGGIPTKNVGAVLLDVTVTDAAASGAVTAYATGTTRPATPSVSFAAGRTATNLVVVPLGTDGRVDLANGSGGSVSLIADVAGYLRAGTPTLAGMTAVTAPATSLDTRTGTGAPAAPVRAGGTVVLQVGGRTGVPGGATAALLEVTARDSAAAGAVTVSPTGARRPDTSSVSFAAGKTVTGMVAVKLGTSGRVSLYNGSSGTVNLAADVVGWVLGAPDTTPTGPAGAVISLGPVGWSKDRGYYEASQYSDPDVVDLFQDAKGRVGVATYDTAASTLGVQLYDPTTHAPVGAARSLSFAGWPKWGGFYAAPDGSFFVAAGRYNAAQSDTADVIVVRHYDRNWALLGTATVQGGVSQALKGVVEPFAISAAAMVQVGDKLVLHMGRKAYQDSGGTTHQSDLTLEIDVPTMTARSFESLGQTPYASHSFKQLVTVNGSNLVFVDHGDLYPRGMQLSVMADYPTSRTVTSSIVFPFNGAPGTYDTFATATGLVSGPRGVVLVGNSVDNSGAPNGPWPPATGTPRNVYTVAYDPGTGATSQRWLSAVAAGEQASEPRVVPLAKDRFAVLFAVTGGSGSRTEYRLIDSGGTVLAGASFPGLAWSAGSDPLAAAGRVYWPVRDSSGTGWLYALDVSDPVHPVVATA